MVPSAQKSVAGNLRFSVDDGAKVSIQVQERAIRDMCAAKGWEFLRPYADEGLSGGLPPGPKPEGRPGLADLLSDMETGEFNMVAVYEFSRLARDQSIFWALMARMRAKGVAFVTAMFPDVTSESPVFEMLGGVTQASASFMRRETSFKVLNAQAEMRKQGMAWNRTPAGFESVPMDDKDPKHSHRVYRLNEQGRKVREMLDGNPDLKAVTVEMELGVPHATAWRILRNVRGFESQSS